MSQPSTGSLKRKFTVNAKLLFKRTEKEDIHRVTAWAVNFDHLLQDPSGISLFEEFLRREYSEENVEFWKECEDYKNIRDSCTRRLKAKFIYDKYIAQDSPETVNIDDYVRLRINYLLDSPTSELFAEAQKQSLTIFCACTTRFVSDLFGNHIFGLICINPQVYNLMKQDSYPRFLKSDIFKNSLVNKMESKLPDPNVSMNTKGGVIETVKGGSLHRHFKYWSKTEKNNNEKQDNGQNSWIRKRVDSINSILGWKSRNRH